MTITGDAALYRIVLQGHINLDWSAWMVAADVTHSDDGSTVVIGQVSDQAALHGILTKIRDVGMVILSVTRLSDGD